jgi:hypothetical protein
MHRKNRSGNLPAGLEETQAIPALARAQRDPVQNLTTIGMPASKQPRTTGQAQQPQQDAHCDAIRSLERKRAVQCIEQRRSFRYSIDSPGVEVECTLVTRQPPAAATDHQCRVPQFVR